MTVVQKAISDIRQKCYDLMQASEKLSVNVDVVQQHYGVIIKHLESLIPAEEQQIRDAWNAGNKYGRAEVGEFYGGSENENPMLHDYIKTLKQ